MTGYRVDLSEKHVHANRREWFPLQRQLNRLEGGPSVLPYARSVSEASRLEEAIEKMWPDRYVTRIVRVTIIEGEVIP